MIAKGKAIAHGGNALNYAMRDGKMDKVVGRNMVDGDDPADILHEFEMVNQYNYRCKNKYLRFEIGIAPQDRGKLALGDMTRIANTFAHRMGLDNHQWIACTHKDTGKRPSKGLVWYIAMWAVTLLSAFLAGYYIQETRKWKESSSYWYRLYEEAQEK